MGIVDLESTGYSYPRLSNLEISDLLDKAA